MKYSYDSTMRACFTGYIVQAIVNNFVPLLFLTFQRTYHIPLQQITLLVIISECSSENFIEVSNDKAKMLTLISKGKSIIKTSHPDRRPDRRGCGRQGRAGW